MSHRNNAVPKSAIQVAHQLAHNEVSIQRCSMSHQNNVVPKSAIQVAHQLAHNEVSIQRCSNLK